MTEYKTVAILVFKIVRGKYRFYLVKRGENLPAMPGTWTPICSIIYPDDIKIANELQEMYGDIAEDLPDKVTALRILLERDLIHDPELLSSIPLVFDVRQKIIKMDQAYLTTFFSSMVLWGRQKVPVTDHILDTNYYLCIIPTSSLFSKTKLSQYSEHLLSNEIELEENHGWFNPSFLLRRYMKLNTLIDPIIVTFMTKYTDEKKHLIDVARELNEKTIDTRMNKIGILPNILRFETPAPTRAPFSLCNIYVVGNERQFIIDPGSTNVKAIEPLEKYIEENLDKIDGILLTNYMVDHCNQALRLKDKYDLPLYASEKTAEKLYDEGFFFNSYLNEGVKIYLGSYEPLGIKKWELIVVEIPGYSEGQLGYYDPRGVLFSGSLIHKGVVSSIGNYNEAYIDFLDSLKKVSKLKPKYILSGHRDIISNVKQAINFNVKNLEQNENVVLSTIRDEKTTFDEIVNNIYEKSNLEWRDSAVNIALFNLAKLQELEIIKKRGDDYVLS